MRYWWVNQNQTYNHEVQGGFLWSPKTSKSGVRNQFYDNMAHVKPGDLILSFCDTRIKAVGVVQGAAVSASKPEFGRVGSYWNNEGWYVPVEFIEAEVQVRPKDIISELLPHLSQKYAPLQSNGNGNQGVYLAEVSEALVVTIFSHMNLSIAAVRAADPVDDARDVEDQKVQEGLKGRTDIGATQVQQLVLARRGQGVFKANVRLNEKTCRVTGVADPRFLVASHIKPWRSCDDREKLDGCNGLLLSPHIDRLFDRGLITFKDDGTIVKTLGLPEDVWTAWGLDDVSKVAPFTSEQAVYLAHHRAHVFVSV